MKTDNLVATDPFPPPGPLQLRTSQPASSEPDLTEVARSVASLLRCQSWSPGELDRLLHRLTTLRSLLGNSPDAAWTTPPGTFSALETMARRVRDWHQQCPTPRLLADAVVAYKNEYLARNRSARTVEAKNVIERFSAAVSPVFVEEADLAAWLDGLEGIKEKTRKVYHGHIWSFFNWCVQRRYSPFNPCLPYIGNFPHGGDGPIEIIPPSDLLRLLETAIRWRPHWIPILILLFYVGLRPCRETFELSWAQIEWGEICKVHIERWTVKTNRERWTEFTPAAMAWLSLFVPANLDSKIATMSYENWKERRQFLYRKAGVKPLGFNAARHTCESAKINAAGDRRALAIKNDHSPAMQARSYFRQLPPGTGVRYGIFPPNGYQPNLAFDVTQVWGRSQAPPPALVMLSQPTPESWDQFRTQAPASADQLLLSVLRPETSL